jgi:hypothetical protein
MERTLPGSFSTHLRLFDRKCELPINKSTGKTLFPFLKWRGLFMRHVYSTFFFKKKCLFDFFMYIDLKHRKGINIDNSFIKLVKRLNSEVKNKR